MFYTRYDPEAIFWGVYTVDDCESLLGHEHQILTYASTKGSD